MNKINKYNKSINNIQIINKSRNKYFFNYFFLGKIGLLALYNYINLLYFF